MSRQEKDMYFRKYTDVHILHSYKNSFSVSKYLISFTRENPFLKFFNKVVLQNNVINVVIQN